MNSAVSHALEFIHSYWASGLEILILSSILYNLYLYLRGTHGARILIGFALVFLTLTFISQLLDLSVLGWLLRSFSVFLAIALVVLFQPELRRALNELGSHHFFTTALQRREAIEEISDVMFDLSSKGFGALIALERDISLKPVTESGVALDADFSKELLLTIFHPKTVLHDGGVIVSGDRIVAAGCIFPLTQRDDLDRTLGLRHRAGLGAPPGAHHPAAVGGARQPQGCPLRPRLPARPVGGAHAVHLHHRGRPQTAMTYSHAVMLTLTHVCLCV